MNNPDLCQKCGSKELRAIVVTVYKWEKGSLINRVSDLDHENIIGFFCENCDWMDGPAKLFCKR